MSDLVYVRDMAAELAQIAKRQGAPFVAYVAEILEAAAQERISGEDDDQKRRQPETKRIS
jgi:hypothetical protein